MVPFLTLIDKKYNITHGNITTLHPWLSYQNLLDGPATSVSDPKIFIQLMFWEDQHLIILYQNQRQ